LLNSQDEIGSATDEALVDADLASRVHVGFL